MKPPAPLARSLEICAGLLWTLFLVWTALVALVWTCGLGVADAGAVKIGGLREALAAGLRALDAGWIALAAVNAYLALATAEGLATARRWAALIFFGALALGWTIEALFPAHEFTARLGPRLLGIPFGWPLLWLALVLGARAAALRFFPRASHAQLALATATLVALSDANLEPFLARARMWWVWSAGAPGPAAAPLASYALCFAAAFGFAWLLREARVAAAVPRASRAAAIFGIFNAVLLLGHLGPLFRGWLPAPPPGEVRLGAALAPRAA